MFGNVSQTLFVKKSLFQIRTKETQDRVTAEELQLQKATNSFAILPLERFNQFPKLPTADFNLFV